jgi:hypothetical protein
MAKRMHPLSKSSPRQEGRVGRDNSTQTHSVCGMRSIVSAGAAARVVVRWRARGRRRGKVSAILFYTQHGETMKSKEGRGRTSSTCSNCVYQHIQQ